ncbi:glycosyltransferase family 2 protein [Pseudanabaenaceae cyanobacterium LEGE 13415]|nr:glycosyltransferase family 2 protein [Pseudanabaenaceae cyanobacterium LEGE 13415]
MSSDSLVSVLIPAYNAERFIAQTLDSLLAQTYPQFEAIVVDDGSTDKTIDIVRDYMQKDSRIRLFQQNHAGVVAARNLAIQNARGIYLAPLDADDLWYPRKLEKQVQCLDAAPTAGMVYSWSVSIDQQNQLLWRYYTDRPFVPEGWVLATMIFYNFLENGSVPMFRRSCIDELGGYALPSKDLNFQGCEDYELYLRLAKYYPVRVVREYAIAYRQSMGSLVSKHISMYHSFFKLMEMMRQQNPEIPEIVFRWSRGLFYNFALAKGYENQDYKQVLLWFWEGLRVDWALLLRPETFRVVIPSVVKVVLPRSQKSSKPMKLVKQPPMQQFTLDQVNDPNNKRRYPWLRKPYELLMLRRWAKVTQINQALADCKISELVSVSR